MFRAAAAAWKTGIRAVRPRRRRPLACIGGLPVNVGAPQPGPSRSTSTYAIPASVDDTSLMPFFDTPAASYLTTTSVSTGLLAHPHLTTPSVLDTLAEGAIKRAESLMKRILNAQNSRDDLYMVIKNMDKLSDVLCGVIDLAELIRNAHPDPSWVQSANDVFEKLCGYMNTLNANMALYQVLQSVFKDTAILQSLSQEAYYTAMVFARDFEKSAIGLPIEQRNRFLSLSSEILTLGRNFLGEAASPRPPAEIAASDLASIKDSRMWGRLRARLGDEDVLVYPGSVQAQMVMQSGSDESRFKLFAAANSSTDEQIATLERLLRARAELAQLIGDESYAHMTLGDKMAKSPENVRNFLDSLLSYTRPSAGKALHELSRRKQEKLKTSVLPTVMAWDRDFYCQHEPYTPSVFLPPLTPGTVLMGLSRLFRHLYGIRLRPVDVTPGEVWHPDVRKLEVVDEDAGVIGWIYADIFARQGKAGGAAHYTVRCSRRTDQDDESDDHALAAEMDRSVQLSIEFDRAHRGRLRGQDGTWQLPIVVLLCQFSKPRSIGGKSTLEWHEVQTLYHEMGHAMHSMIGRTEYHNVAGTRCATDFVELPSILMEHFLKSPSVLSLFDVSGQKLQHKPGTGHQDPCSSIDTLTQIILASLDQEYHSTQALSPSFDSTDIWFRLQNSQGLIPAVPGASWQTQFGHLYGYGAMYYSYLFDRAIASRVWHDLFAQDPLSREAGEKYKRDILRYGGGRDPWAMISTLLSSPELENGDAEAMREVGRWGIEDDFP